MITSILALALIIISIIAFIYLVLLIAFPYYVMNWNGIKILKEVLPKIKDAKIDFCYGDLTTFSIGKYQLNYWKNKKSFSLKRGSNYLIINDIYPISFGVNKLFANVINELEKRSQDNMHCYSNGVKCPCHE